MTLYDTQPKNACWRDSNLEMVLVFGRVWLLMFFLFLLRKRFTMVYFSIFRILGKWHRLGRALRACYHESGKAVFSGNLIFFYFSVISFFHLWLNWTLVVTNQFDHLVCLSPSLLDSANCYHCLLSREATPGWQYVVTTSRRNPLPTWFSVFVETCRSSPSLWRILV